jgi:hypothetical protein
MIVPLNDAALKAAVSRLKVGDRVSVQWRSTQAAADASWTTWEGKVMNTGDGRAYVAFANDDACKSRVVPNRNVKYGSIYVHKGRPSDSDDGKDEDEFDEDVRDHDWTSETVFLDPAHWGRIFGVKSSDVRIEMVVGKMRERYRKGSHKDTHMVDDVLESIRQHMIISSQIKEVAFVPAFQASVRALLTRLELNRRRVVDRLSATQLEALGRAIENFRNTKFNPEK